MLIPIQGIQRSFIRANNGKRCQNNLMRKKLIINKKRATLMGQSICSKHLSKDAEHSKNSKTISLKADLMNSSPLHTMNKTPTSTSLSISLGISSKKFNHQWFWRNPKEKKKNSIMNQIINKLQKWFKNQYKKESIQIFSCPRIRIH